MKRGRDGRRESGREGGKRGEEVGKGGKREKEGENIHVVYFCIFLLVLCSRR